MQQNKKQEFDNTLKALFGKEAKEIVPRLVPGTEVVDDKNIEIDRTILKADLVYNVMRNGRPHILDMELQTGADSEIDVRVLQYHVGLLAQYRKPVITVILYPFETTIPKPPFEEKSDDEVLLSLHYRVLALWKLEAQHFVDEGAVCLYTLLPAMQGANAALLIQALGEMKAHYTHQQFGHHLIRFRRIMQRSKAMSEQDKKLVEEELRMHMAYDWFLDDNPDVQERVEKGMEKGIKKGRLQGLQRSVLKIVKKRFPSLMDLTQQRVVAITDQDELDQLIDQLLVATDEGEVRVLLKLPG
ncbi:MAG TPA: hypothetical protein VGU68_16495 [Ktedonobacteraceae bacterium]|nr:hypothetical protein [Ktedonobacteraceae bacterium]